MEKSSKSTWAKKPLIDPQEIESLLAGRYCFINIWRNISDKPVQDWPLALCDANSFSFDDIITREMRYPDRTGETYICNHQPSHEWYYFPNITRDECIFLKVWDSRASRIKQETHVQDDVTIPAHFSFHTAFKDTTVPEDCPRRESMEVRLIAFF